MSSKNNVMEEIQELVQQIKKEYQEEVDFEFVSLHSKEVEVEGLAGFIKIISPRLKKYCRERFNFPFGVNDYLDYEKQDQNGSIFSIALTKTKMIGKNFVG